MYVVAGVTGRSGKNVAETLLGRDEAVRVIVRRPSDADAWRARGAEVAMGSLDDEGFLARALAGAKGAFLLLPEELSVPDFHAHRGRMADAIASAVASAKVERVVFLSAILAALSDGNGPAKDLHRAERALARTETKLTIVRACFFQENVAAMLPAVERGHVLPSFLPSPDASFPMIATCEVGRFAARCLLEPVTRNEIVDLVGPSASMRDVASKLARILGRSEVDVVTLPPAAHVDALTGAGLPRPFAESLAEMYACIASGRAKPEGDRMVMTATTLDETLASLERPS